MVEQKLITVYDYHGAMNGSAPWNYKPGEHVDKYEVNAWCVGGEEGIIAFFFIGNTLCEARGDDGHWWLLGTCHKDWLKQFQNTVVSIKDPNEVLNDREKTI